MKYRIINMLSKWKDKRKFYWLKHKKGEMPYIRLKIVAYVQKKNIW